MENKKKKGLVAGIIILLLFGILLTAFLLFRSKYADDTIIVYFSRVGNTTFSENVDAVSSASLRVDRNGEFVGNAEVIAKDLHSILGAPVHRITIKDFYPEDYDATVSRASEELNAQSRPELSSVLENMDDYENIILIYPVWWSTIPMPVSSFLESYDFNGKTILPIATHKGSFLGNSVEDIKNLVPDAKVKDGISISGDSVDTLVLLWIGAIAGIACVVTGYILYRKLKENKKKAMASLALCLAGLAAMGICIVKLVI